MDFTMTKQLTVVGLDPSLRNLGMVKGILSLDGENNPCDLQLTELLLVSTESETKKLKTVRKNSQDLERCKTLYNSLQSFLKGVDLVFIEMPVGSQTARAMCSYGVCVMLAASISKPLIQVTPTQVKEVTGNKKATKASMIAWAVEAFPDAKWINTKGKISPKNEHLADAVAAIVSGANSAQLKEALTFFK